MLAENANVLAKTSINPFRAAAPNRYAVSEVPRSEGSLDSAIELRARTALWQHRYLRQYCDSIQCCHRDGRLTMAGVLPSFYLKQLAQEAIRDIKGIAEIENRIAVSFSEFYSDSGRQCLGD